jgi:hypothetical protein
MGWYSLFPFLTCSLLGGITLLESQPGCGSQLALADYNYSLLQAARRTKKMKEKDLPLGAIYALENCSDLMFGREYCC